MRRATTSRVLALLCAGLLTLGAAACGDDQDDDGVNDDVEQDLSDAGEDISEGVDDASDEIEEQVDEGAEETNVTTG
jgi:hypothetical protein